MKIFYVFLVLWGVATGCGNDFYHDSGLADGKHDCTVWEYLQTDHYNWDSVIVMIEHAGLKDVFDGTNPEFKQITFFAPTNLSVNQFLFKTTGETGDMVYSSVKDVPVELCRKMLLAHVLNRRMMKEDFDYEVKGTLTGGTMVTTIGGVELRVYRTRTPYNGIPDIGPESLFFHAVTSGHIAMVASADIEMMNGVVHSLSYTYEFTKL
ncbi:MAG: fasciclin domain-containing protein [Sanguibacteroides justesenii]|jgi:putative lipoprotein|nr:fasciclin domain-containing protein [Sanguibacteroides justesenii]